MEYARLNEEAALKRKLMEQEADERCYKSSIAKKAHKGNETFLKAGSYYRQMTLYQQD